MGKININTILLVAVTVMATLLIYEWVGNKSNGVSPELVKEQEKHFNEIRRYDSLLTVEKLKAKDLVISTLKDKDTVIIRNINSSNDRIKNIPATVNNIVDDAGLRAAAGEAINRD